MDALKKAGRPTFVAIGGIVVLAILFWAVLLSPKRDEVAKLEEQMTSVEASLSAHRAEIAEGEEARKQFPVDYQRLVVLGKAVPGDDDTASLLVQIQALAFETKVEFKDITLESESSGETTSSTVPAEASPTEAAASLLPLGATIGPAGLGVMPYSLTFRGTWFTIADFIKRLDALVKTKNENVAVDGRLITIDGFSLAPDPDVGLPALQANFGVTTYLTPPTQGVTAGASPEAPLGAPAAVTTGGTP